MKNTNSLDLNLHKKALGLYTQIEKDQLKNNTPAPFTEIANSDMTFNRGSIRGVVTNSPERVEESKNEPSHTFMHVGQMMDMKNCNVKELHINFNNASFVQETTVV